MKRGRKILSLFLVAVMCILMGITAYATEEKSAEEELTPEELEIKKEQDENYALPVQTNEIGGWPEGPGTYEKAAIVMEVSTGAILYAKNIDEHLYPASITKVLTALVALKNGKMDDPVRFSHDSVAFLEPGDSSIGMKEGNKISLEQALFATLLASANEAAYAVGENVGKNAGHDYSWFIGQMNATCRELGGENSNFVNTNGLHNDDHYTCVRDMALIGRELFQYPDFFRIVQTREYKIPKSKTTEEHVFQQKHKMLNPDSEYYYKYAVAGKTGFTSKAEGTLFTLADNKKMQLVCVVMRSRGGKLYPDTKALFQYGFKNFEKTAIKDIEQSGDIEQVLDEAGGGYVILPKGLPPDQLDRELVPDSEAGSRQATLTYSYGGNTLGSARVVLSDAYIEQHTAKTEEQAGDKGADEKAGKESGEKDNKKEAILIAASVLLIILVINFLFQVIRIRRYRNRRRKRR